MSNAQTDFYALKFVVV